MPYTSVVIERFGGLDVQNDPKEVGAEGATDLLNVDLDKQGRARTRDGLAQYDASGAPATAYDRLVPAYYGTLPNLLLTGNTGSLFRLDRMIGTSTSISSVATYGSSTSKLTGYASLGTPTSSQIYLAVYGQTLRKYDGAALTATSGKPAYVGAWENRLAQGWFIAAADSPTGANGSKSTVVFSDAGAPDTYSANNYIHLEPGDGEEISGIATIGNNLIVAKQTNLFVFYNTSVASDGSPIFDNRRLTIPGRISNAPTTTTAGFNSLVASDDGIYFVTNRGLMLSTGGPPVLVSEPMTPIFDGTAPSSLAWDGTSAMKLEVSKQRVFIVYTTVNATERVLVWDTRRHFWTVWSFPNAVTSIVPYGGTDRGFESTYLSLSVGAGHLHKLTTGQATDYGTAIASSYTSGFYDLGSPGKVTDTRYTRLFGSGTPTIDVFTDGASTDPSARGAAITLGVAPAEDEGWHQVAYSGKTFAHKLGATSGAWQVDRLTHDVAWTRP